MNGHAAHDGSAAGGALLDWWIVVLPLAALAAYIVMAMRQRRQGRPWNTLRTASFALGITLLAIMVSPPVSAASHDSLGMHMVQHLAIGMFAPLALVLGAPVTLLLRILPVSGGKRISALMRSPVSHLLTHPVTAMVLNIGGMYVLYLTPLYALSLEFPALHGLVNLHFLAAGYLFTWSIMGPDPAPRRPSFIVRLVVLVISLGLHAFLGKLMYAYLYPRGIPFSDDDIREAALLMYYGGDIAELLVAIALFATWYGERRRRRERAATLSRTPGVLPVAS